MLELVVAGSQTPPIPEAEASWGPTAMGWSGTSSASSVGRAARVLAKYSKSSSWSRIAGVILIRYLSVWRKPSWRRENKPRLPGIPMDMLRSSPRTLCHSLRRTRVFPRSSSNSAWRRLMRWAGSCKVCWTVSISHPRTTLRVHKYASPCKSFLRDGTCLRTGGSSASRGRNMPSMTWRSVRSRRSRAAALPWIAKM